MNQITDHEPEFDEHSVQTHAFLDTEIPLPAGAAEAIQQARKNHLAGGGGELRFAIEVKRANGKVEKLTLNGRVDGAR